jgi:hypothetical protein
LGALNLPAARRSEKRHKLFRLVPFLISRWEGAGVQTDRKNLPLQLAGKIDWELIDGEIAPLYSDIVQRAEGIRKTRPQRHS